MSYYHIKNIDIDKKNNKISADLADSCFSPLEYFHIGSLCDKETFEEKYANFIYNVVSGNFHPQSNNRYSKLVMNHWLENYYDDAHDIGEVETYNKYKEVINGILTNNSSKIKMLESDKELNPEKYYCLKPIEVNTKYEGIYYANEKGKIFNYTNDKGLQLCDNRINNYGEPICVPSDIDKFIEHNEFLQSNVLDDSVEL